MTASALRASLEAQLDNCAVFWEAMGIESRGTGEIPWFRSGVAHPLLNGVRRSTARRVATELPDVVDAVRGTGGLWWVGEDSDPTTRAQLKSHGLAVVDSIEHMARETGDLPPTVLSPAGLRVRQLRLEDDLESWVAMWAPASGLPDQAVAPSAQIARHSIAHLHGYLPLGGYLDGEVVGSAIAVVRDGVCGIYAVATREDLRHQGIGTAMTLGGIRAGHDLGATVVSLQPTDDGKPLYDGLGFTTISDYAVVPLPE